MDLPRILFSREERGQQQPIVADALVLGWFQSEMPDQKPGAKHKGETERPKFLLPKFTGRVSTEIKSLFERLNQSKHFQGKKNEISCLRFFQLEAYPNALLLGLGTQAKWSPEIARQVGAALFFAQKKERFARVAIKGNSIFGSPRKLLGSYLKAFCEGYVLASYDFRELKKVDPEIFSPIALEVLDLNQSDFLDEVNQATSMALAVNFARSLGDSPGNFLTPHEFARRSQSMAKERGLRCTVLGRTEMSKERMGLFLGVARGSAEEPQLIIIEHRGGRKGERPIALIGKGVTFDSGGISLKPASRMEDMKYDMMGAAAVAGILQAVADLKIPRNVVGLIGATENMPDGMAQKPGDVARSLSGKTVEIINTDAEGRLVLADVLEYAQKHFQPQAIIDFATLTGAVVDALGTVTSGIMGNHEGLLDQIKAASRMTGERVWELPLYDEYEEDLRSHVADIKNSGVREAGSSKGGTFLKFFVDGKYPWVHCDIAGTAYYRKDVNYHLPKFGSGVMVRLITHLLENWQPLGRPT